MAQPSDSLEDDDLMEELERFVQEAGVDESSADALRGESRQVICGVIDNGIRPGARNPSALLMSLIKKMRDMPAEDQEVTDALEAFLEGSPDLDETARETLRTQHPQVIERVLARGSFDTSRNPSALLMARVRDARRELEEEGGGQARAGDRHREAAAALPVGAAPGTSFPPSKRGRSPHNDRRNRNIRQYCEDSGIDEGAESTLRQQSWEVIETIIGEGVIAGRNPSALLMARLRQIGDFAFAAPERRPREAGGPTAKDARPVTPPRRKVEAPWRSADSRPPGRRSTAAEVREFCKQAGVDEEAEEVLAAQSERTIQTIIKESNLRGRNPSALLMSRIRQLEGEEGVTRAKGGGRSQPSAHAAAAAERALSTSLEDLRRLVWDWSAGESAVEDALRHLASARRAARAAQPDAEPPGKRRRAGERPAPRAWDLDDRPPWPSRGPSRR